MHAAPDLHRRHPGPGRRALFLRRALRGAGLGLAAPFGSRASIATLRAHNQGKGPIEIMINDSGLHGYTHLQPVLDENFDTAKLLDCIIH